MQRGSAERTTEPAHAGVRILIADDHELARTGLRLILEGVPGWRVCAEAVNGEAAVELARAHQPTVAIVDLNMPVLDGLAATEQIRRVSPDSLVIVITAADPEGLAERVQLAGAHRCVLKTSPASTIVSTVRFLVEGQRGARCVTPLPTLARERLTRRELEILQLLAEGRSNASAALVLGIAATTVETHRANILRKLEKESIVELVHVAIREELIRV